MEVSLRGSPAVSSPDFHWVMTLSDCVGRVEDVETGCSLAIGLPTFLRFARFRVIGIPMAMIVLEISRETAQTAKGWPFSVPASRGRALSSICASQLIAHGSLTTGFN